MGSTHRSNQPITQTAYFAVSDLCDAQAPGRLAVVECLSGNGLDVLTDGVQRAGPWDSTQTINAWTKCRDTYATWFIRDDPFAAGIRARYDCVATTGWLNALATRADYSNPAFQAARQACPS